MPSVAFIGLGTMGAPMARNLIRAGHQVVGFNRSRGRVDEFVQAGGEGADSIGAAVAHADVVVTMLPDTPDVERVVLGPDGIFDNAKPGTLLIDSSTIAPTAAARIAAVARDRGLRAVDAPVSGGEHGATDGSLSIMIGGDDDAVEAAMPILQAMGSTIVHVGPPGAGQLVKAANQLIIAGTLQVVAEALVMLDAAGVDRSLAVRALSGGMAGSRILERKAPRMMSRTFDPTFRAALHHKDLGIVESTARELNVVTPVGALVNQLMGAVVAQGNGEMDHAALYLVVEALSGR